MKESGATERYFYFFLPPHRCILHDDGTLYYWKTVKASADPTAGQKPRGSAPSPTDLRITSETCRQGCHSAGWLQSPGRRTGQGGILMITSRLILLLYNSTHHSLPPLPQANFRLLSADNKRTYEFNSDSVADKQRWIDTLNEEIARLNAGGRRLSIGTLAALTLSPSPGRHLTLRSVRALSVTDRPLPEGTPQTAALLAGATLHGR